MIVILYYMSECKLEKRTQKHVSKFENAQEL
jgi:hypothetical protein